MSRLPLLTLIGWIAFAHPAAAQQYQVTETIPISGATGYPDGAWNWWVSGVNASGLVVGGVETTNSPRMPYAWTAAGGAVPLGVPAGNTSGIANFVNSQGWAAGTSYTDFGTGTPTLWKNGAATAITVPGQTDSEVTALSNAGHVAGITGLNQPGTVRGFVWNDGTFTNLQSLGLNGSGQAVASGINSNGLAVGYSELSAGVMTATKWINGTPTSLGVTGEFSGARAVNEAGNIIVGTADSGTFIMHDGEIQYLNAPAGAVGIQAKAVNETGDVVGTVFYQDPNNRTAAFLYHDGQLIMGADLFGAPGITQSQGLDVTDDGRVFVIGLDGQFRQNVYELSFVDNEGPPPGDGGNNGGVGGTPGVPEPATALLLGIAGLTAAGWRRVPGRAGSPKTTAVGEPRQ